MQITEQAIVESLNPNMWPIYSNIPWRKTAKPMSMAIIVGSITENVFRTPYIELPSQRIIFPSKDLHEDYRVITSYHYTEDAHFSHLPMLDGSEHAFAEFFHSNVMHYAMCVAGGFNSLQHQAFTMPSWKVQEATDSIGNMTAELGYFVAASLNENQVSENQVIVEAISFVGALGQQIGVPIWSQVSSQYVYKGALRFLEDYENGNSPTLSSDNPGNASVPSTDEFDMDVYGDLKRPI